MAPKDSSDCVVTVTIELGHQAHFLREPSPEGFTHDWTVFVRGQDGNRLDAFVEKVVFRLHKTFKCPLRTISEPPYKVTESGYAGFLLPIEIHFKNKQSPRKIVFTYDLFLNAKDSPPINNVRIEKLKFQNPTPEFKAKLFKAGGIEQGADPVSYALPDQMLSFIKTEPKKSIKAPKDKEKKKKKKSPPKSVSPDLSLSSLSSSSSLSDNEPSFSLPQPPQKKEKETLSRKTGSFNLTSAHSKSESSHIDIDKHKIASKEKYSSESDLSRKPHKHKSKDKDSEKVSTSHKSKEVSKKEKEVSHKEREGSHSSTKSSGEKKSSSSSSSHKERSSSTKEKESTTSVHSEKQGSSSKEKEKQSSSGHKSKHSSHKDLSSSSLEKKAKSDASEIKIVQEKHPSEVKSHKRSHETPQDNSSDKKKFKRSTSISSVEEKYKTKVEPPKVKHSSKHKESKEQESQKIKGDKEHKSSSSKKSKHEPSKHSEKHKQTPSSETKHKEKKDKSSHSKHHESKYKPDKTETVAKDHLAMNSDFQPKLLISPLKDKSSDEGSHERSPVRVKEQTKLKRSKSISSHSSHSSVHDLNKSDTETQELQVDKAKNIISGLTDSDSDSGDENVNPPKTSPKEQKTSQPKQVLENSKQSNFKSLETKRVSELDYSVQENRANSKQDKTNKSDSANKNEIKKVKEKEPEAKMADKPSTDKTNSIKECDILAPNGFSLTELITINEKIERAQTDSNRELIHRVIDIIGNTDDFDLDENSVFFDICSVDKGIVLQIQAALKEY